MGNTRNWFTFWGEIQGRVTKPLGRFIKKSKEKQTKRWRCQGGLFPMGAYGGVNSLGQCGAYFEDGSKGGPPQGGFA